MSERADLLASIANTTADYRVTELDPPTSDHVDRWIGQFDEDVQLPILREMDHVLEKTYFSLNRVTEFLRGLLHTENLVGENPCDFWRTVKFLDIQQGGNSQREFLAIFSKLLKEECGFGVADCGDDPSCYLYLDDGLFTGNRIRRDIEAWIAADAPDECEIHVVSIALHSGGQYYANGKIAEAAQNAGKSVELQWWRAIELEDRRAYTYSSDVLRPTTIPDDALVHDYVNAMSYQPNLRTAGSVGSKELFSSDEARNLLEQELLIKGAHIREQCPNLGDTQRPLGHMTLETLGFGSLIVTFRNCPNNAPLALWVGDPWYPLFPRVTNSRTALARLLAMLEQSSF